MKGSLQKDYRPSEDEPYMNSNQVEYFRLKLLNWRMQLMRKSDEVFGRFKDKELKDPDPVDQGTLEANRSLELKKCNRYLKLIHKIEAALDRIEDGTYGYCEETGEELGIERLKARPIATLSVKAQKRHEYLKRLKRLKHGRDNMKSA